MTILKKFKIILSIIFFITGCSKLTDSLSMKKKSSNDQFLIEKKDPLVLPPNFERLPDPTNKDEVEDKDNNFDIKNILGQKSNKDEIDPKSKEENLSLKKSILNKIKKN